MSNICLDFSILGCSTDLFLIVEKKKHYYGETCRLGLAISEDAR
jgi:hypothetical protein